MAATCAVCLEPIVPHEKFLVVDTEVVHRTCVGAKTLRWTLEQRVAELQQADLRLRREALDAARLTREAIRLGEQAHTKFTAARVNAERLQRLVADQDQGLRQQTQELAAAHVNIQSLEARLAAAESRATATPESTARAAATAAKEEDDPMGIATRFSLLELD